jgi:hypothetical protein
MIEGNIYLGSGQIHIVMICIPATQEDRAIPIIPLTMRYDYKNQEKSRIQ